MLCQGLQAMTSVMHFESYDAGTLSCCQATSLIDLVDLVASLKGMIWIARVVRTWEWCLTDACIVHAL